MNLHLNHQDGTPVYQQIIQQVKHLVASGRLTPGQEIPPIRKLAEQLLINPNTVARAYRDLEQSGWVFKRRGAGTYIAERCSPLSNSEKNRILGERASALLAEAHQMNVPLAEVIDLLHQLHRDKHSPPEPNEDQP
ncbi:MAG: GntR family transcriptional regulator [Lysobacteraceae bacterium]|nr:MAG: GntR family transcriptional regulator [Xanthomonadaceae bacterium]